MRPACWATPVLLPPSGPPRFAAPLPRGARRGWAVERRARRAGRYRSGMTLNLPHADGVKILTTVASLAERFVATLGHIGPNLPGVTQELADIAADVAALQRDVHELLAAVLGETAPAGIAVDAPAQTTAAPAVVG